MAVSGGVDATVRLWDLVTGEPLGEPIVQYGPFVMNTADEIRQAFTDVQRGKFGPIPD